MPEIQKHLGEQPIIINPAAIVGPGPEGGYPHSRPDTSHREPLPIAGVSPDADLGPSVAERQLRDVRARAGVEQAMGSALEGTFDRFAGLATTDKDGAQHLALRVEDGQGSYARVDLTRRRGEDGGQTAAMLWRPRNSSGGWETALVYTDGPGELPLLQYGEKLGRSTAVGVYTGEYQNNNSDSQIAWRGKLWLDNLEHAVPRRHGVAHYVGRAIAAVTARRSNRVDPAAGQ